MLGMQKMKDTGLVCRCICTIGRKKTGREVSVKLGRMCNSCQNEDTTYGIREGWAHSVGNRRGLHDEVGTLKQRVVQVGKSVGLCGGAVRNVWWGGGSFIGDIKTVFNLKPLGKLTEELVPRSSRFLQPFQVLVWQDACYYLLWVLIGFLYQRHDQSNLSLCDFFLIHQSTSLSPALELWVCDNWLWPLRECWGSTLTSSEISSSWVAHPVGIGWIKAHFKTREGSFYYWFLSWLHVRIPGDI